MSTAVGASLLAHGLHYSMVLVGLWGLGALLLPHTLDRVGATTRGSAPGHQLGHPLGDQHARRVAALRVAVASGSPGIPTVALTGGRTATPQAPLLAVPLALVASAAAAGIHAAVAPAHLGDDVLSGAFFLVVAATQVAWAAAAQRPSRALLHAGAVLNAGLVALWLLTRTVGLPLGLMPTPHAVGPWDLACVLWELAVVAACLRALRDGVPQRCPDWFGWHPLARAAVGAAACSLVLLTISGAHS